MDSNIVVLVTLKRILLGLHQDLVTLKRGFVRVLSGLSLRHSSLSQFWLVKLVIIDNSNL